MIKSIKEISIKELKSQFDHLSGYVLLTIFIGLMYFFFLKTFFVDGTASLRELFQMLPWYLALIVPAITMGSFSSEFERQTFEYLETKPINQFDLVVGKILGTTKIIFIAVLLTFPLPILINKIAPIDIGETISGYLAAFVLILALCSMGVAVSTLYKNQIASFLTTAALILALIIINSDITAINLPTNVANILAQFSIIDNYAPLVRGVLSIHNIVYFIIFIAASVAIAYTNIQKIRFSSALDLYKRAFSIVLALAVLGVALVYVSDYFAQELGRIDLTSSKRYTLSPVTKEILNEDGKITVEVYASDNLPPKYQLMYKEIKNILADYASSAKGKLTVKYLNPKTNGERLSSLSVQQVQYNTVGEDQVQIQQGYLALVILNEDESKKDKIDYIQSTDDLEYQITSMINKIKSKNKPAVGFASGNGEKNLGSDYTYIQQLLSTDYDLKPVYFKSTEAAADKKTAANSTANDLNLKQYNMVVIAGPGKDYDEDSKKQLDDYINGGGNVLYLADTFAIDSSTGGVTLSPDPIGKLLENYGVTVNKDITFDQRNALQIPLSNGLNTLYPYFPAAPKDAKAEDKLQFLPNSVITPWSSSLNVDQNWSWLYATSNYGGKITSDFNLDPAKLNLPTNNLGRIPLIVYRKVNNSGTIIVAGTSKILDDQFASQLQQNAILGLSIFENLAKGKGLSQIKVKNLSTSQFTAVEDGPKQMVNYGAPIASAALLILIGASRVYRKRKLAKVYA
jgi:ABC-2 type transport system permease protein